MSAEEIFSTVLKCKSADNLVKADQSNLPDLRQRSRSEDWSVQQRDAKASFNLMDYVWDNNRELPPKDDTSSNSSRYFDKSDFIQTNWQDAVEYIPPVGFAVVAGGLAIVLHPAVVLAGALTAVGTAHAAGATYDFCVDGSLCNWFEKPEEDNRQDSQKDIPELKEGVSEVTFTMTEEEKEDEEQAIVSTEQSSNKELGEPSLVSTDPSRLNTASEISDWTRLYYPSLSFQALEKKEFFGLNAIEFFSVFLADDAPYTFEEFQRKRQDKDIQYGQWETLANVRQPSLHAQALCRSNANLPNLRERILKFKAKTNSYFGPPYATTTKVQRALVASKKLLVLESKTTLADIPFCDRFYVMERWVVTAEKGEDDQYRASLSVFAQVFFSKKCPFEPQITKQSKQTIIDIANQWSVMAEEALKSTEQARAQRIHREQHFQPGDIKPEDTQKSIEESSSNIEVQHISANRSVVVGERPEREVAEKLEKPRRRNSLSKMSQSISKYVKRRSLSATRRNISRNPKTQ